MRDLVVLGGSSHPELTQAICERLAIKPGNVKLAKFSNKETNVTIFESVRNLDVYIVQSGCGAVNDHLMELMIMISACIMASAKKVTVVLPLFPYARQPDAPYKRNGMPLTRLSDEACTKLAEIQELPLLRNVKGNGPRSYANSSRSPSPNPLSLEPDSSSPPEPTRSASPSLNRSGYKLWIAKPGTLIADMLVASGAHHIITLDLHHPQYQGYFNIPVDNLMSFPLMCKYIIERIPEWRNAVIVSPDAGGAKRATAIADTLNMRFALIHKDRRHATSSLTLVGDVEDHVCVLIDDLVDTCHTLTRAAHMLLRNKASKIYALVTHGIFSTDAINRLEKSPIDTIIVSNSVPQTEHTLKCSKIKVFDIAPLLAEAIRRIHNGESVSFLFDMVPIVN
ncbi:ribose-phosphate pyrophosphokinase [Coelomomyces lativittatus]|nr:ribose-phosphate pyrophosphokinase [Coelomomyces lativittatus]KAJ1513505.1 ribose-phosphate pyrophosphokinase [Coelomomyces lativittatus]KAJ1514801.1 ribose-phosphate pyrophosphokinase [Coelomomyces lativittatus]